MQNQPQPTITLEPPWYRCENGNEFRGLTSKPPVRCPVCGSGKIEMVAEIDSELLVQRIPCCKCGQPTTWDSTYNDLCYRCCRADNE